jgi:hypothetical protein
MRLGELGDERWRGHEQHRVAGRDGRAADRDGQVRDARRPQEQRRLPVGDEAPRRELADLALVDALLA